MVVGTKARTPVRKFGVLCPFCSMLWQTERAKKARWASPSWGKRGEEQSELGANEVQLWQRTKWELKRRHQ